MHFPNYQVITLSKLSIISYLIVISVLLVLGNFMSSLNSPLRPTHAQHLRRLSLSLIWKNVIYYTHKPLYY